MLEVPVFSRGDGGQWRSKGVQAMEGLDSEQTADFRWEGAGVGSRCIRVHMSSWKGFGMCRTYWAHWVSSEKWWTGTLQKTGWAVSATWSVRWNDRGSHQDLLLKAAEGEGVKAWISRATEMFGKCRRKVSVTFPVEAQGWLILHRYGMNEEQKAVCLAG